MNQHSELRLAHADALKLIKHWDIPAISAGRLMDSLASSRLALIRAATREQ